MAHIDVTSFQYLLLTLISEGPGGGGNPRDLIKLKKQNQQLSEENNLLKVKIDVLLDMVSYFLCSLYRLQFVSLSISM